MTTELAGIRKFLKRTRSLTQLQTMAEALFASAESEVTITSTGFEGGSTSGQAKRYSKADILNLVEDLIAELTPATGDEAPMARSAMVFADWSGVQARV
jgi:hypothetical protein